MSATSSFSQPKMEQNTQVEGRPFSSHVSPSEDVDALSFGQRERPMLLMQRPGSSGIDMTGFSFAKPSSQRKGFSLRSIPTHSLMTSTSADNLKPSEIHSKFTGVRDQSCRVEDVYTSPMHPRK